MERPELSQGRQMVDFRVRKGGIDDSVQLCVPYLFKWYKPSQYVLVRAMKSECLQVMNQAQHGSKNGFPPYFRVQGKHVLRCPTGQT